MRRVRRCGWRTRRPPSHESELARVFRRARRVPGLHPAPCRGARHL